MRQRLPGFLLSGFALGLLVALASPARAAQASGKVQVAELAPEVERAIDKGLAFLAKSQNPDGSWGHQHPAAITGLTLMAFMLKGHFPKKGPYGTPLEKGLSWLIKRGEEGGGYLGGPAQGMYEHGLATLALAEVWGMSDREEVRDTLKRAVDVIQRAQNPEGGWRYQPRPIEADLSVTVMQIMALASAQEAGILVPAEIIQKAVKYVTRCQKTFEGGFTYQPGGGEAKLSSSAAGLLSLLMCGERTSKAVQRGLEYIRRLPEDKYQKTQFYYYAHYYAIQAMYQAGETSYQEWYPHIRDALLAKQRADGAWVADSEEGDPCYGTAMSILILGVPYRFLPIYQR